MTCGFRKTQGLRAPAVGLRPRPVCCSRGETAVCRGTAGTPACREGRPRSNSVRSCALSRDTGLLGPPSSVQGRCHCLGPQTPAPQSSPPASRDVGLPPRGRSTHLVNDSVWKVTVTDQFLLLRLMCCRNHPIDAISLHDSLILRMVFGLFPDEQQNLSFPVRFYSDPQCVQEIQVPSHRTKALTSHGGHTGSDLSHLAEALPEGDPTGP